MKPKCTLDKTRSRIVGCTEERGSDFSKLRTFAYDSPSGFAPVLAVANPSLAYLGTPLGEYYRDRTYANCDEEDDEGNEEVSLDHKSPDEPGYRKRPHPNEENIHRRQLPLTSYVGSK